MSIIEYSKSITVNIRFSPISSKIIGLLVKLLKVSNRFRSMLPYIFHPFYSILSIKSTLTVSYRLQKSFINVAVPELDRP